MEYAFLWNAHVREDLKHALVISSQSSPSVGITYYDELSHLGGDSEPRTFSQEESQSRRVATTVRRIVKSPFWKHDLAYIPV